ncbi:MAG: sulfatase-like hydrolase/transferase [Verrucomicrobiota bacterium]
MKTDACPKRRPLLPLVSAILASAVSLAGAAPAAHPNVIFILTDDLGWGDVGVFFQKSRQLANVRSKPWQLTPNLDQCAARGVLLHDHYCPAPVCAPSRASFLLGVSQGHANVRDNQFDKSLENNHTIATVLRRAGYTTVAVGKWGLQGEGPGEDSPATWPAFPTRRGFDAFFGYARHATNVTPATCGPPGPSTGSPIINAPIPPSPFSCIWPTTRPTPRRSCPPRPILPAAASTAACNGWAGPAT